MKESQSVEFKREWKDEYLKWISGFANASGGTLLVGVDDNGQAVGVHNAPKLLEDLPNKVRDVLGILVEVNLVKRQQLDVIEIVVPAFAYPISYKGEYHYRTGSTKQELKGAALDHFLLKKQGLRWDAVTVPIPKLDELHEPTIARFKRMAVHNGRLSEDALQDSNAVLLEKLRLIENQQLKRAAVLLFHADPECLVTNAYIKIGFFADEHANLLHHDEVHGNLFDQVFNTIEVLKLKYFKAAVSYEGIVRQERFPVPLEALREALLNAVVHKDYASAAPIQISVYPDKLMIWNPGELPNNWTLETLMGKHSSRPFNPDIANAFFRSGLIESWGRGIERIFKACEQEGVPAPEWNVSGGDFWAIFHFSCADVQPASDTIIASTVHDTDQDTVHETAQDPVHDVSDEVKALLSILQGEKTRNELMDMLGLAHRGNFRALYLQPALEQGWIEMTLPDKPQSRHQKYRLTRQGKTLKQGKNSTL